MNVKYIYLTITLFCKIGINIFVVFFVANKVSLSDFGIFSLAFVFSSLAVSLLDYGFNLKSIVLTGRKKEINKQLSLMIYGKIIITIICIIFFIFFIFFNTTYDASTNKIITLLTFSAIPTSFGNFYLNSFKIVDRFDKEAKGYFIQGILLLLLLLANEYIGKNSILYYAYIITFVRIIYFLYSRITFAKLFFNESKIKVYEILLTLKKATPYAIHFVLGVSIIYIDTFMLSLLSSKEDVGLYQAGMRIIMATMFIAVIIGDTYIPEISKLISKQRDTKLKLAHLFEFVLFTLFLVLVTIYFYDKTIIIILFSEKYLLLESFTFYIVCIIFLRYLGIVPGIVLTSYGKQDTRAKAVVLAVVFSVILNFILIPVQGIEGAFISSLIAHIVLNVIYVYKSLYVINYIKFRKKYILMIVLLLFILFIQKLFFEDTLKYLILTIIINFILMIIYYREIFFTYIYSLKNKFL